MFDSTFSPISGQCALLLFRSFGGSPLAFVSLLCTLDPPQWVKTETLPPDSHFQGVHGRHRKADLVNQAGGALGPHKPPPFLCTGRWWNPGTHLSSGHYAHFNLFIQYHLLIHICAAAICMAAISRLQCRSFRQAPLALVPQHCTLNLL